MRNYTYFWVKRNTGIHIHDIYWCLVKMHGSSKKNRKSKDQVVREETHTYVISYPTWGASLHMVP
ncbi:hypothetical protein ERO13_A06G067550v2 [Gossypium hirsutum]|uniref:Uncharacterized protein n=3 Tax=Gossypium TaxID=3633 RepID=A0A5J5VB15_GOSBA|nr:hypothetical protein ES319_A06G073900v1 [Gossypium barbadense]KAG4194694.1 hypothetical protein ERO13_A06G067550v2 [Gossypium hirsutum]TYH12649.1 hypothetical protein ES288_A06G083500v1 [Gossypium darwinii]TYI22093.1 hypothetical protein ES332_A06G081000v1 [Gossypium tomentosum]